MFHSSLQKSKLCSVTIVWLLLKPIVDCLVIAFKSNTLLINKVLKLDIIINHISSYVCAYRGCKNSRRNSPQLPFYGFPIKNVEICNKLIINCGNIILIQKYRNM